jgi:hypothetical protein
VAVVAIAAKVDATAGRSFVLSLITWGNRSGCPFSHAGARQYFYAAIVGGPSPDQF